MVLSRIVSNSFNKAVLGQTAKRILYTPSLIATRSFSSAQKKIYKHLTSELQHEKSNFEKSDTTTNFLKKNKDWTFTEKDGDTNMSLKKTLENGKTMTVEFQLVSPFQPEGEDMGEQTEMTDFSVTIENEKGNGITFHCSTLQNDEKFRYMIGNVRYFQDTEAKNSMTSFNGPDFEDLADNVQESFDEWLNSLGVDDDLCNFIDACSVEKEQKEYMSWLSNMSKFVE